MPKDECTEPYKNITGEDRIAPSYQKKNQIRGPKGNLLLSWMFYLSKYEIWSCESLGQHRHK